MKTYTRAIRRHHRARLIRRVESFGEGFRAYARKLYNNRKFCTCPICGNPRRFMKGSKRNQLTVQERRQAEQMRADEQSIGETASFFCGARPMTSDVLLRDVTEEDLPIFFEQQLDPAANIMAAFTAKDPADRDAFTAHWTKIRGDDTVTTRTILFDGQVAGYIARFERFGEPEVSYWLGKEYWGQGIATGALTAFLGQVKTRPLYARAAKDNLASLRVLEKCGFAIRGEDRGFSNARGEEVEEYILKLEANETGGAP